MKENWLGDSLMNLWVDQIPAVGPITCRLRCSRRPRSVRLVPGAGRLATRWSRGRLTVVVPRLHIHACVVVTPVDKPGAAVS